MWLRAVLAHALMAVLALSASDAGAHAFVTRTEPMSGATVAEAPALVRIWFDGPVEPVFIDVRVEDGAKHRVDRGAGRLSPTDSSLVEVRLAPLAPGRYRVYWSVVARDSHRRDGNFTFLLK